MEAKEKYTIVNNQKNYSIKRKWFLPKMVESNTSKLLMQGQFFARDKKHYGLMLRCIPVTKLINAKHVGNRINANASIAKQKSNTNKTKPFTITIQMEQLL